MTLILLIVSMACSALAACAAFDWFGITANYGGFLALALLALAASFLPWPPYFRR